MQSTAIKFTAIAAISVLLSGCPERVRSNRDDPVSSQVKTIDYANTRDFIELAPGGDHIFEDDATNGSFSIPTSSSQFATRYVTRVVKWVDSTQTYKLTDELVLDESKPLQHAGKPLLVRFTRTNSARKPGVYIVRFFSPDRHGGVDVSLVFQDKNSVARGEIYLIAPNKVFARNTGTSTLQVREVGADKPYGIVEPGVEWVFDVRGDNISVQNNVASAAVVGTNTAVAGRDGDEK